MVVVVVVVVVGVHSRDCNIASARSQSPPEFGNSSEVERDLCRELASRLEGLLAENEAIRGRVAFLEEEVSSHIGSFGLCGPQQEKKR